LDEDALRAVVHIITRKTNLDQTSVTTLVKNLFPAQRVPADVVVTVVGALGQGHGKPSPISQDGLVKWLVIVHEIMADPSVLSRLYGVLFGMLGMISIRWASLISEINLACTKFIRTSLCHLLSLITRRKHVKPFRIQQLYVSVIRLTIDSTTVTDAISDSSIPVVLAENLHSNNFCTSTRITTPTSFSKIFF
jgi:centromere protein I